MILIMSETKYCHQYKSWGVEMVYTSRTFSWRKIPQLQWVRFNLLLCLKSRQAGLQLLFKVTKKLNFFVGFPPSVQDFFCHITCTFKHPCLQLFRFEIAQFVPFWIKNPQNPWKIVKKGTKRYLLFIKKVLLVGFEWAVTLNRSCKPAWHDLISFKWGHWH